MKMLDFFLAACRMKSNLRLPALLGLGGLGGRGVAAQVRPVEEVGEEQQVAQVHERGPGDVVEAGRAVALLHPAVHQRAHRHPHDHLQDLSAGDEHGEGAGHAQPGGPRGVIAVHERVHAVVHGHEPAAAGHHVFVGVPGVEQHGDVVVPVQEEELLLPEHDERRVACRAQTHR